MMNKIQFIKTDFAALVATLDAAQTGNWGLMTAQQMVEHVADFFKVSNQQIVFELITAEEDLPKYKAFLLSDKEFKENTKAPMLPDKPFANRNATMQDAVDELQQDIDNFFKYFETDKTKTTTHPVFGALNFDEWVQLHYKHILHHAKQFGLI